MATPVRQFERFPVSTGATFNVLQNKATGTGLLRNISLTGGYIQSSQITLPNSWIHLKLLSEELGSVQTTARILRQDTGGFGLHFAWTDRSSLQKLRDFLEKTGKNGSATEGSLNPLISDLSLDSILRKSWASFVKTSSDSLLNTIIGWCHNAFFLDQTDRDPLQEISFFNGLSPAINEVHKKIMTFAPTSLPVLLTGETGTGKEVFSRAIHQNSRFMDGPFIPVNCGAIPMELAESLLFGHEKGSFTGAHAQQKGYMESAESGTLFLDEIGDLPLSLQVKLLRVLQERVFTRIGSHKEIALNCRIVTATNKNLKEEIQKGRFRQDLFYRLEGVMIAIPPLRERTGDLVPMARFLVKKISRTMGLIAKPLSLEAEELIAGYPWRGNVRELGNALHRAVVVSRHLEILPSDLGIGEVSPPGSAPRSLRELRDRHERDILWGCLVRHAGNVAKVADELGISRPSVYNMLKRHDLDHAPL
ncbi:MAG: sigma 54-interacting transcriptional regulator [Leptospirales bacterium]